MKKIFQLSLLLIFISCSEVKEKTHVAELSCGQCQFGLKSQEGCDLAVKIDDTAYFVDGAHIDDYGDAHNPTTGFCEVVRPVEITGKIVDGRFKSTSINLIKD